MVRLEAIAELAFGATLLIQSGLWSITRGFEFRRSPLFQGLTQIPDLRFDLKKHLFNLKEVLF